MFGILDRYIGRSILFTTFLVLLTLIALASIFSFIRELDDVGTGDYRVTQALQYILLTVPGTAYMLFAPAVLLGSLLGLGAMASSSELTVMRAAGISTARIIRSVLLTGVVLMLLIALVGETIMPRAEQAAERLRMTALEEQLAISGSQGLWLKSTDRYINIGNVLPDFTLLSVDIHQFNGNQLLSSVHAASALPQQQDWLLQDIAVTLVGDNSVTTQHHDALLWSALVQKLPVDAERRNEVMNTPLLNAEVLKSLSISPESLSATDLREQVRYLHDNQLDSRSIELAFWVKVASPLSTLVMLMLSLPFVFASQRSGGAGQKIFIGIVLGIAYALMTRLLTQLALTNGFAPIISAFLPLFFFLLVALLGIRRVR